MIRPDPRTMREIAAEVAARHGLTVADLIGPSQERRYAHPRHEAFALIYDTGRYSLPRIGMFFGRDHSTVRSGAAAHEARARGEKPSRPALAPRGAALRAAIAARPASNSPAETALCWTPVEGARAGGASNCVDEIRSRTELPSKIGSGIAA